MKISGIAKYFAVYLGSWRNSIWEVGGISFGKMAEFHLGRWRNFIWEDGGIPFGKMVEKRLCGIED